MTTARFQRIVDNVRKYGTRNRREYRERKAPGEPSDNGFQWAEVVAAAFDGRTDGLPMPGDPGERFVGRGDFRDGAWHEKERLRYVDGVLVEIRPTEPSSVLIDAPPDPGAPLPDDALTRPVVFHKAEPAVAGTTGGPSAAPAPRVESTPDPLDEHRLKRDVAALRRERDELLARLHDAEARNAFLVELSNSSEPLSIQRRERASGLREGTAFALASDWHVEETVDPATVNGLNAYDLSIAQTRARRFFSGVSAMLDDQPRFRIRELVLWLGGDLITGTIHDELLESNGLSPMLAVRFVRRLVGDGLRMLLSAHPELERITVPCSHGNHGRNTHKPRISTGADNSLEHALYLQLADDFRAEPRVRFDIARGELVYLSVYDRRFRFTHGDAVKYGGGVGGITIPISKAVASWDRSIRADVTCMGHWHQLLYGGSFIVNGSLIGPSAYTVRIKAAMEPGQQAFFLADSKRGLCQQTPIWTTPAGVAVLSADESAAVRDGLRAA